MKRLYVCPLCKTVASYELKDPKEFSYKFDISLPEHIDCICGKSTMISMNSEEYAYGKY